VLRVEMIARNVKDLNCGKLLTRVPEMLAMMQHTLIEFLNIVQAVHHCEVECPATRRLAHAFGVRSQTNRSRRPAITPDASSGLSRDYPGGDP
jgi:hypothetical protein